MYFIQYFSFEWSHWQNFIFRIESVSHLVQYDIEHRMKVPLKNFHLNGYFFYHNFDLVGTNWSFCKTILSGEQLSLKKSWLRFRYYHVSSVMRF